MRVLDVGSMFPPHYLGGYELLWEAAVRDAGRRGHDVRVLTTDYSTAGELDRVADVAGVHRDLRWYWHDHAFPALPARRVLALERHNHRVLRRHLREFRPEVVRWWALGGMSLSLVEGVRRAGIPAIGVVGDAWMTYGPKVDRWSRIARRAPRAARLAGRLAGVPAPSPVAAAARWTFISSWLLSSAGPGVTQATIAHPGVSMTRFQAAQPQPWRWALACVGRVDARKGLREAVRAMALLPDGASLVVDGNGDGRHVQELRSTAAEIGRGGSVTIRHSARDDIPAVYRDADVVLFVPTWDEPWGLVGLEAMACGTPLVATGTGGSAEYLEHGRNCLMVERGDPAAIASAVRRLAEDGSLRERLRAGGLETVRRFEDGRFFGAIDAEMASVAGPDSQVLSASG